MLYPIDKITIGERARKEMGDLSELRDSMHDFGLLQPIGILKDGELVFGERRLTAAKELAWEAIDVRIITIDLSIPGALLHIERDENHCRKPLLNSEAVALGRRIEEEERKAARMRKRETQFGQKDPNSLDFDGSVKLTEPQLTAGDLQPGETLEKVAAAVGMSKNTYKAAKEVVEAAEADPSLQPIVDQMDRTGKVAPAHRQLQAHKNGHAIPQVDPEPGPVQDDDGKPVPDHLVAIFAAAPAFRAVTTTCEKAVKACQTLEATTAWAVLEEIQKAAGATRPVHSTRVLAAAQRAKYARPALVCTNCKGMSDAGDPCGKCNAKGWLTVGEAEKLAKEAAK